MKKIVIILSVFSFFSCNNGKQGTRDNEQFNLDSTEQARIDSLVQETMASDMGTFIDQAGNVFIISEKYKNANGIGINSTIEEFAKKYPDSRILYIKEKNLFIIESFQAPLKYVLDEKNFIGKLNSSQDINVLKQSDFKPNTKITKMWMK